MDTHSTVTQPQPQPQACHSRVVVSSVMTFIVNSAVAKRTLRERLRTGRRSFFAHARMERNVHELSSCQKRKSSREMESERIRILLERQRERILSEVRTEIHKHEFQADSDGRGTKELSGIIESQRREIDHTIAGDEQLRRDQLLLHEQLSEQNRDLREAHIKSLYEMEELRRYQESRFDEFSRIKIDRKSRHYS